MAMTTYSMPESSQTEVPTRGGRGIAGGESWGRADSRRAARVRVAHRRIAPRPGARAAPGGGRNGHRLGRDGAARGGRGPGRVGPRLGADVQRARAPLRVRGGRGPSAGV